MQGLSFYIRITIYLTAIYHSIVQSCYLQSPQRMRLQRRLYDIYLSLPYTHNYKLLFLFANLLVIFVEFRVVFTVSFFVGNSVF